MPGSQNIKENFTSTKSQQSCRLYRNAAHHSASLPVLAHLREQLRDVAGELYNGPTGLSLPGRWHIHRLCLDSHPHPLSDLRQLFTHQLLLPCHRRGLTVFPSPHGFRLRDHLRRFRLSDIHNNDDLPSIQRFFNPSSYLYNCCPLTSNPQ